MANCVNCIHDDICELLDCCRPIDCEHFKDRSRFVELPCKIGDKIYFVFDYRSGITEIKEVKVTYYRIRPDGFEIGTTLGYFTKADLGVDVFLTREEAEQALKEHEEK